MNGTIFLSLLAGALFSAGVYLILRRNLLRMIFGLALLSNAVNLLLLTVGGLGSVNPPLVAEGMLLPETAVANPLPQALVLTAIVIGFGLFSYALVLARRGYDDLGTMDGDRIVRSE